MNVKSAVHIDDKDNCVTLAEDAKAGETVSYRDSMGTVYTVTLRADVPQWHKAAIRDIPKGSSVIKYGVRIGTALCDIAAGDYVHCHNVK